ncbi:MAG: FAD-dependent oxidoreductase [Cocleimonas sp.]|nr:FAD-dependent oxidoreductase [Cocleimonas sp.]
MNTKKVVIVGGVAGGASVAARARRLSETAEIIIIQRGRFVSFANCGLPFHISGEIKEKESLLIQTPEGLKNRFNLDVRTESEVISIDREKQEVSILNAKTNEVYTESYDDLVLSPGAAPIIPPLPGITNEGIFTLRVIRDMDAIMGWNDKVHPQNAVVIGGGFIGLEMVEQLARLGMNVSLVEAQPQVLPPIDPDMAMWLQHQLKEQGIDVRLNDRVVKFADATKDAKAAVVCLESGEKLNADLVILSIGVQPETGLAKDAGLKIGELGGIRVNQQMRTEDPHIWAVGDAIEVKHPITQDWARLPLAGPANRQGRIAANNIMGRPTNYRGTWGTAVVRVFDLTAASTGLNEKQLIESGISYESVHIHPYSHVTYYPGAAMLEIKLLFSPDDGTIYGAQIIGSDSVERRLDVIATAIQGGLNVDDLAQLELSYAPPYGAPKDPVNLAGMAARNVVKGDMEISQWHDVDKMTDDCLLLDVRDKLEYEDYRIPHAINIPLDELRGRLNELPNDKKIIVQCLSGHRSYFAYRMLRLYGFSVSNMTGGIRSWQAMHPEVTSQTLVMPRCLKHVSHFDISANKKIKYSIQLSGELPIGSDEDHHITRLVTADGDAVLTLEKV